MKNKITKISLLICAFGFCINTQSQILQKLERKIERKVNQRIDRKSNQMIDKGLDKAEDGIEGSVKKSNSTKPRAESNERENYVTSKFDFVPGEKILFQEAFINDAKGDFPARWNTNGSGEIVSISNQEGKWLKIPDNSLSYPEIKKPLPENFTVEFDLFYPSGVTRPPITFGFTEVANPAKTSIQHKKVFYFHIPATIKENVGYSTSLYSGRETTQSWPASKMAGKVIRVSIAVNTTRIRLYMNSNKIFDLPKTFDPHALRNNFHFRAAPLIPAPQDGFYISNLRIAESGMDARSQLIQKGVYSTTGIYFESGSATIKPESAGILKEIAGIMHDHPDMKIIIKGHTDGDGNQAANEVLSKKRAEAVKAVLSRSYSIDNERMETEGKGASRPVSSNDTEEGKAQNRRVEFVKR